MRTFDINEINFIEADLEKLIFSAGMNNGDYCWTWLDGAMGSLRRIRRDHPAKQAVIELATNMCVLTMLRDMVTKIGREPSKELLASMGGALVTKVLSETAPPAPVRRRTPPPRVEQQVKPETVVRRRVRPV